MKNRAKRAKSNLRSEVIALQQRMCNPHKLIHTNLRYVYPPVGAFPDVRLPSSTFKGVAPEKSAPTPTLQPKVALTFTDHLVQIEQFKGRYRDTLLQLLSATYAALCRFVWKLTSGGMQGNAEIQRHGGAQRIGR